MRPFWIGSRLLCLAAVTAVRPSASCPASAEMLARESTTLENARQEDGAYALAAGPVGRDLPPPGPSAAAAGIRLEWR
jgi:hypothetical protein